MEKQKLKELKQGQTQLIQHYLDTAQDLAYPDKYIIKIANARTEAEIQQILHSARNRQHN